MTETRVPSWFAALSFGARGERIYELFSELLHHLPVSATELAHRLEVSQPAISRWASGAAHPSLEQMERTVEILQDELLKMGELVQKTKDAFALVDRAVLVSDCQCLPSAPFCDTCSLRSNAVRDELHQIHVNLAALLDSKPDPGTSDVEAGEAGPEAAAG